MRSRNDLASEFASMNRGFRFVLTFRVLAKFWASIRCMWPTKASCSRLCHRMRQTELWLQCGVILSGENPKLSVKSSQTIRSLSSCERALAGTGSWTCYRENRCRAYVDQHPFESNRAGAGLPSGVEACARSGSHYRCDYFRWNRKAASPRMQGGFVLGAGPHDRVGNCWTLCCGSENPNVEMARR